MMKKLSKPLVDIKPEDIFEECASSYRDKNKVASFLECKDMVRIDSMNYDKFVPSELEKLEISSLPSNIDSKEMANVYKEKFATEKGPGRKYYNEIKGLAERGVCPICGIRIVKTLDH